MTASTPRARYPGDHIEVSKPLQVLFVVRGGRVILVSHVSTGATGNTPAGRWHVYSKVPGWLPDGMFDSSFFLRGFAIHGYPTVPFYPGSHGCVRVPLWLAPRIEVENHPVESGGWRVRVQFRLPLLGPVGGYEGVVMPEDVLLEDASG